MGGCGSLGGRRAETPTEGTGELVGGNHFSRSNRVVARMQYYTAKDAADSGRQRPRTPRSLRPATHKADAQVLVLNTSPSKHSFSMAKERYICRNEADMDWGQIGTTKKSSFLSSLSTLLQPYSQYCPFPSALLLHPTSWLQRIKCQEWISG